MRRRAGCCPLMQPSAVAAAFLPPPTRSNPLFCCHGDCPFMPPPAVAAIPCHHRLRRHCRRSALSSAHCGGQPLPATTTDARSPLASLLLAWRLPLHAATRGGRHSSSPPTALTSRRSAARVPARPRATQTHGCARALSRHPPPAPDAGLAHRLVCCVKRHHTCLNNRI